MCRLWRLESPLRHLTMGWATIKEEESTVRELNRASNWNVFVESESFHPIQRATTRYKLDKLQWC